MSNPVGASLLALGRHIFFALIFQMLARRNVASCSGEVEDRWRRMAVDSSSSRTRRRSRCTRRRSKYGYFTPPSTRSRPFLRKSSTRWFNPSSQHWVFEDVQRCPIFAGARGPRRWRPASVAAGHAIRWRPRGTRRMGKTLTQTKLLFGSFDILLWANKSMKSIVQLSRPVGEDRRPP